MGMMILAAMGVLVAIAGMPREAETIEVVDATPEQMRKHEREWRRKASKLSRKHEKAIRKHERNQSMPMLRG